ncbi:membrane lipoprotein lipid attachment site-containing protein [Rhodoferax sp.]|uniref:membrane lipoprotein lipid attachment site-containing protein n=1 Tax=Rhodoferax sp. TaxID=50421 RepID=UPI00261B6FE5|nr:membrane lipoprotein lipid attachment site-containing protein [Rhodoferax sp.]MDD2660978.1 membrane lipoprotein lipid attachment site-containing protein [Methylococcales bacterium]MDD5479779.1 membrane lipoprotein lipid attachment site-containing protein [Rhodoferax sp.]
MKRSLFVIVLLAGLAACGEKPQALETNKHDSAAYTGTGKAFTQPDWKPGDKASWESHLKAREQYGQNDYTRMQ